MNKKNKVKKGLVSLTKDICFQMFFEKDKGVLLDMLKSFLPLPDNQKIESITSVKTRILSDFVKGKVVIFDIHVKLNTGESVAIEMQNKHPKEGLWKRMLYYSSKLYIGDFKAGEDYEKLKRTYLLLFTTMNVFPDEKNFYSTASMRLDRYPYTQLSDYQIVITVEISKVKKKAVNELVDSREEMCYLLGRSESLTDKQLDQLSGRSSYMKQAIKTLKDLSQDEQARYLMEQKAKDESEIKTLISYARKEGMEKGRSEGLATGMEQVALNMLKANLDADLISKVTGLSKADIQKLSK